MEKDGAQLQVLRIDQVFQPADEFGQHLCMGTVDLKCRRIGNYIETASKKKFLDRDKFHSKEPEFSSTKIQNSYWEAPINTGHRLPELSAAQNYNNTAYGHLRSQRWFQDLMLSRKREDKEGQSLKYRKEGQSLKYLGPASNI